MLLFQRITIVSPFAFICTLHSTMLLFQQGMNNDSPIQDATLHSTMLLFQPNFTCSYRTFELLYIPLCFYFNCVFRMFYMDGMTFTFHYASISTIKHPDNACLWLVFTFHYASISTLRPEMSKRMNKIFTFHYASISTWFSSFNCITSITFTFHYASISTKIVTLIPRMKSDFTFHYASISTMGCGACNPYDFYFTFHYASISTDADCTKETPVVSLHSTMLLFQLWTSWRR